MKPIHHRLIAVLLAGSSLGAAAIDLPGMDPQVRPQDDLYRAANGRWLNDTPLPPERSEVFGADLPARLDARVRTIVEQLAAKPQPSGSSAAQIARFYRSHLDTAAIDRAGLAPLRPLLREIAGLRDARELAAWQGRAQGWLQTPIWLWGGFADFQDPGLNRVLAWQGGLGLPSRDFYLPAADAGMLKARAAYREHLARLATLAGLPDPQGAAEQVLALETRLAAVQASVQDSRDPAKMYNPLDAQAWAERAPGFDWPAFLGAAGIAAADKVTVAQLGAATGTAALVQALPLAQWKLYLSLRSLDTLAPVLPAGFRAAHFAFHGQALSGASQAVPRDQAALAAVSEALGDALAQAYVQRHFSPAQRERVKAMVAAVLAALRTQIESNPALQPATRAAALAKLDAYKAKVGYPDQWRSYAGLQIRAGDALGNLLRAKRHRWAGLAAQSGQRMDGRAWQMSPLTVNAFYDPQLNEINLPAGILQAPLFDMAADDAENFGGIGAQIGHEISHGFDNLGSQFDAAGVMRDWMDPADRAALPARMAGLVRQYAGYEALPGKPLNGELTLPENLADVIGLQIAFKAYQATLAGKPAPVRQGLSGEQRFFIAFAQSWRIKQHDERRLQLLADPHAPNEFRTNGPVQHVDGFHQAFGTQPGDRLYLAPPARLRLW
jgi:putative endopeptidase